MNRTASREAHTTASAAVASHEPIACPLSNKPVFLLGEPAAWLTLERHGDEVALVPKGPMPRRCCEGTIENRRPLQCKRPGLRSGIGEPPRPVGLIQPERPRQGGFSNVPIVL